MKRFLIEDSIFMSKMIEWIVKLRYVGYAVMLIHAYMRTEITKAEYIAYGAVILFMERMAKDAIKK